MTNGYFNHDAPLARHTLARAEDLNARLGAVEAGFGRLPTEAELKQGRVTYATAAGAADSYHLTLPYPPTAYTEGMRVVWRVPAGAANTGPSAVNVNGLGVKPVLRIDGTPATRGDLPAGGMIDLCYDGTAFRLTSAHSGDLTLARDWAVKMGGPVAGNEYSAKHHATQAAGSAAVVAAATAGAETAKVAAETARDQALASASAAATSAMTAEAMKAGAETARTQAAASASAAGASAANATAAKTGAETARDQAAASASGAATSAAGAASAKTGAETARDQAVASASAAAASATNAATAKAASETARDQATVSASNAAASAELAAAAVANSDAVWCGMASGTAAAIILTPTPSLVAYATGATLRFVAAAAAAGATTVNVSGLGARTIKSTGGAAVIAGAWASGDVVTISYTGSEFRLAGAASIAAQVAAAPVLESGQVDPVNDYIALLDATDGGLKRVAPASMGVGNLIFGVLVKAGNYTTSVSENRYLIKYTAASNHTIPAASVSGLGWCQYVAAIGANVTVYVGASSIATIQSDTSVMIVSNGSSYDFIRMGSYVPPVIQASSTTTLNPADIGGITLSNGNMTYSSSVGGAQGGRATKSISSGAYYCEWICNNSGSAVLGWATGSASLYSWPGWDQYGWSYRADGAKNTNNVTTAYGTSWSSGAVTIGLYAKSTATNVFSLWVSINGVIQGGGDPVAGTNPMFSGVPGPLFPAFGDYSTNSTAGATAVFSAASWQYPPPSPFIQIP